MQRFWLHPGADKGRQIEHGVAIQHQVVVDELVGQIGVQAMLRQLIARQHSIGLAALMQAMAKVCLLYTSPSPRDRQKSRMPSSA